MGDAKLKMGRALVSFGQPGSSANFFAFNEDRFDRTRKSDFFKGRPAAFSFHVFAFDRDWLF